MAGKALVLDPQMKILLDTFNAAGPMFLRAETPEQARVKMQALLAANPIPAEPIYRAEDRHIPGVTGEIPVRVYTPEGNTPMGVLVFFHGGGWVLGDLESHDRVCRALANKAGCVTVSVDYRLAPEHVFPAARRIATRRPNGSPKMRPRSAWTRRGLRSAVTALEVIWRRQSR